MIQVHSRAVIDIAHGSTFEGRSPYLGIPLLLIGCAMMVAGAIEDAILIPLGLPLVATGLVIFMKIKGITIDPQKGRLRIYENYFLFRLGRWMDLTTYDRIVVERYREKVSHRIGRRFLGSHANIHCFQVILTGGPQDVELQEFRRKSDALALARKVSLALDLPLIDLAVARAGMAARKR